jgi:predicted lipid-binding transport protein (Tim44 family)
MAMTPDVASEVRMATRKILAFTALLTMSGVTLTALDVWARASSGGSRGSRSFSAPSRPSPAAPTTPSSPSRSMTQPAPAPAPMPMAPQRPSFFGGMMGGIAGFALGGLLGGMLFGGLGHGMGGFGGIGLFDILLIGGGIVLLMMFLRRRRQETPSSAYAGAGGSTSAYGAMEPSAAGAATLAPEMPASDGDLERGLGHIRSMDPAFDAAAMSDTAKRMFQGVQQAVTMRDVAWVRDHLGPEMYAVLQDQCDRLRAGKQTNRVEKIDLKGADVTEAWQESGQDFVTVHLTGAMLDYTVDDASGNVVDGSKSTPTDVDEYWTFMRPVGPNRWKLSAIQTA